MMLNRFSIVDNNNNDDNSNDNIIIIITIPIIILEPESFPRFKPAHS